MYKFAPVFFSLNSFIFVAKIYLTNKLSSQFFNINISNFHLSLVCEEKMLISRSSRPKVFCKKVILRNFAKFTENTYARVSFLMKLQAGLQLYQKRDWHRCFPVHFAKFPDLFLQNTSGGCF